eukprot:GEMP01070335.1.p1 GENE.GEMP01070335.1~~GEMP01070335.1.p1  ORF type:complete len:266 (+),score=54.12 GEMP01070335.1:78-875(+)
MGTYSAEYGSSPQGKSSKQQSSCYDIDLSRIDLISQFGSDAGEHDLDPDNPAWSAEQINDAIREFDEAGTCTRNTIRRQAAQQLVDAYYHQINTLMKRHPDHGNFLDFMHLEHLLLEKYSFADKEKDISWYHSLVPLRSATRADIMREYESFQAVVEDLLSHTRITNNAWKRLKAYATWMKKRIRELIAYSSYVEDPGERKFYRDQAMMLARLLDQVSVAHSSGARYMTFRVVLTEAEYAKLWKVKAKRAVMSEDAKNRAWVPPG